MLHKNAFVFLLFVSHEILVRISDANEKVFEKNLYSNGSVACALDNPTLTIPVDQLLVQLDLSPCVAPGAVCAHQCIQDPDCTNYNYKKKQRTCEFFHYTPIHCRVIYGCSHAQLIHLGSCQVSDEDGKTAFSKESDQMTTTKASTTALTPLANRPTTKTTGKISSSETTRTTIDGTVVSSTTKDTITLVPPPTLGVTITNPCDQLLASALYLMQINRGFGLQETWSAFKYGFSDSNGGYWMGNEYIHQMTNDGNTWKLCMYMQESSGGFVYSFYNTFILDSESTGYTYYVSGLVGSPYDGLGKGNRLLKFTTKDKNNQPGCTNWAITTCGGWWFNCSGPEDIDWNGVGSSGFYWQIPPFFHRQFKMTVLKIGY